MKNDNTPTFLDVHPYPPPKTTTTSSSSYERVLLLLLLSTPPPLHQSIYRLIRGAAAELLFSGTFTVDLCGDSGQGHQHHARFVGIGPNSSSGNDRHALHESHAKLSAEAFPGCQGGWNVDAVSVNLRSLLVCLLNSSMAHEKDTQKNAEEGVEIHRPE